MGRQWWQWQGAAARCVCQYPLHPFTTAAPGRREAQRRGEADSRVAELEVESKRHRWAIVLPPAEFRWLDGCNAHTQAAVVAN